MYESFFQFNQRPFAAAADAGRYFPAASIENARQTLTRLVERSEGVGLLIGSAGTGKTMLCQVLADQFRGRFEVALLASGRLCTRRALLQAILFELSLPYRGLEEGELRLSLIDHLSSRAPATAGLVLLIDEAHTLPLRLLEELRMLTNLVRDGQPRVRPVLAGNPMLEERFASPKLESFNQRLAGRCYLESMNRQETIQYVRRQIELVGGRPERVFSEDALQSVHRATDGIPRLVNQVCDHALILACASGRGQVNKTGIEEAWADLQQLPTPWNAAKESTATSESGTVEYGSVEFGSLDDFSANAAGNDSAADDGAEAQTLRAFPEDRNAEPAQRIERIQRQLASIDDDFRPAGTIGPEVELVFPGVSDPFGEDFIEEEVVLDRYASLDAGVIAGKPVSSREGRELGRLLASFTLPETPSLMVAHLPPIESKPAAPAKSVTPPSLPAIAAPAAEATPSELVKPTFEVVGEPNDEDLILVEDDVHGLGAPAPHQSPRVRRQEYRQLFAKLRRG